MTSVFLGKVLANGKLVLGPSTRALLDRHLKALGGKQVDVIVRIHRNARSSQANRYYWGVVIPLLGEFCGYDRQDMHEALAMKFLRIEDDPITGSPRRKHTPETDTKEFAEYVDACIRFGAELGVEIPEPSRTEAA